ncbi:MAG: CAP domain-containing protein [bacterium]|nr:CAP domain-containing protein [bacterium]
MKVGYSVFPRIVLVISSLIFVTIYLAGTPHDEVSNTVKSPQVASATTFAFSSAMPNPNVLLQQVNNERQKLNLPTLLGDAELANIATVRAQEIVAERQYSHKNSSAKTYFDKLSNKSGYSCENLALESSMDEIVYFSSWLNSTKGHKECMLNDKITKAGYAVRMFQQTQSAEGIERHFVVVAIHSR